MRGITHGKKNKGRKSIRRFLESNTMRRDDEEEEGKVREGMTDEKREVKMGKGDRGKNRDNGRREGKCFMTAVEPRLTNTPKKRSSTTLRTFCLETWPTVGESQMSLVQKGGCFWDSPMYTLRA